LLYDLNANAFSQLASLERRAMAGGLPARGRHSTSGCSKKGRDQRRRVGNRATWLPKNPLRPGKRPAFAIRRKWDPGSNGTEKAVKE
jgi:hypothetical protein